MKSNKPFVIDPNSPMVQAFARVGVVRHNTEVLREQRQIEQAQSAKATRAKPEESFQPLESKT